MGSPLKFSPGCGCCCGCRDTDIALVVNRGLSMSDSSDATVRTVLQILQGIVPINSSPFTSPTCKWLSATYNSFTGSPYITVHRQFTLDLNACVSDILGAAFAGYDPADVAFPPISYLTNNWVAEGGRSDPEVNPRILFWISDVPPNMGGIYTRANLIADLVAADIRVIAISCAGGPGLNVLAGDGLPNAGIEIAAATGGVDFDLRGIFNTNVIRERFCDEVFI